MYKITDLGKRIGYLYDKASQEDKKVIETVLEKYSDKYPLIFTSKPFKLADTPQEAKNLSKLFDDKK